MKFVYLGYDVSIDVLLKIIGSGHELVGIISYKADETFTFHSLLEKLAQKCQIPFTTQPIDSNMLESFMQNGCIKTSRTVSGRLQKERILL